MLSLVLTAFKYHLVTLCGFKSLLSFFLKKEKIKSGSALFKTAFVSLLLREKHQLKLR